MMSDERSIERERLTDTAGIQLGERRQHSTWTKHCVNVNVNELLCVT